MTLNLNDSASVSSLSGAVVVQIGTNGGNLLPVPLGNLAASAVKSIVIHGGEEGNSIDLSGVHATDFASLTSINVDGGNGNDSILGSNDFGDSLFGGDGADTLDGPGGGNTLGDGDGADVIRGGANNDSILGGDGADTFAGGSDADVIFGGDGDDSLNGQGVSDTIVGN